MYIRNDQVLEAVRNARVPAIFEGTSLRAYGSAVNSHSVYGFTSAQITRCGQPLSDALREVLADALTAAIQHKGPPAGFLRRNTRMQPHFGLRCRFGELGSRSSAQGRWQSSCRRDHAWNHQRPFMEGAEPQNARLRR